MAAAVCLFLSVVSVGLAVLLLYLAVSALFSLRGGRVYACSDPAGFGIGTGCCFVAALAGIAFGLPATFVYGSARVWGVTAIAGHTIVIVLNRIAIAWNSRLEAKSYAERRARERS
jgi:hypothetical protein